MILPTRCWKRIIYERYDQIRRGNSGVIHCAILFVVWRVKRSALRLRLTGLVVQPRVSHDLLTYNAIGSNYLSFVVSSMLDSTSPLDEAGTATHFPFLKAVVGRGLLTSSRAPTIQSRRGHQFSGSIYFSKTSNRRISFHRSFIRNQHCIRILFLWLSE